MKTKGITLVTTREYFKKTNDALEKKLFKKLTSNQIALYQSTVATSWLPMHDDAVIKTAIAELILPDKKDAGKQLQRLIARQTMSGLYSFFFKIPKIHYLTRFSSQIWKTFWQKGTAQILKENKNEITLLIKGFPELDPLQLPLIEGFIIGILELTGLKNIRSVSNTTNPHAWDITAFFD